MAKRNILSYLWVQVQIGGGDPLRDYSKYVLSIFICSLIIIRQLYVKTPAWVGTHPPQEKIAK